VATAPRTVRLAFDEPVVVVDATAIAITALDAPAVPLVVIEASAIETIVEVMMGAEMTPDARYRMVAAGVTDAHGNACVSPFDAVVVSGFR
ncbi:Ig-like domain-containing protein, partial [Acinetobacter baumannii]